MSTTTTLRPTATTGATGWTFGGGGTTVHGSTSDNSDAVYAMGPDGSSRAFLTFGSLGALTSGTQIRSVQCRVRWSGNSLTPASFVLIDNLTNKWYWLTAGMFPGSINTFTFKALTARPGGGAWTPAAINNMSVAIAGANTNVHFVEVYADVIYNQPPTVTVTGPTGTSTTQTPTITWTYSDPDSDPQERWVARVFRDDVVTQTGFSPDTFTYVLDSGSAYVQSPGAIKWTSTQPIPAGVYWAYVKVADNGSNGRYSSWSRSQFTITGSPPATPVVNSVTSDTANGRNVITATAQDNLVGYNQAGFELTTDGTGFYVDTNCTLATATSTASNEEGARVLTMTNTAASIAKARSGGQWGSLSAGTAGQLAIHASTPARASRGSSGGTATTASFTPPSGALLIAMGSYDNGGSTITPAISDSLALTWTSIGTTTGSQNRGETKVWRAVATGAAMTVSTSGSTNTYTKSLQVLVITGQHATPIGATGTGTSSTNISQNYTSTAANSWGFLAFNDWNAKGTPSAGSGNSIYSSYSNSYTSAGTLNRQTVTGTSGSTVTLSTVTPASNTIYSYVYFEIVPATTPPTGTALAAFAGIPVQPSTVYTAMTDAWQAANVSRNVRLDVEWYDGVSTTPISTDTGPTLATLTTSTMATTTRDVTSPSTAVVGVLVPVHINPTGASEVMQWDRFGLIKGSGQKWSRGGLRVINLLGADAGSQQTALGGWVVDISDTTTVTRVADASVMTGQILRTSLFTSATSNGAHLPAYPATAGETYTLSSYVKKLTTAIYSHTAQINFLDVNGTTLATYQGAAVDGSTTAWSGPVWVTGLAPTGTTQVEPHLITGCTTTGAGRGSSWTMTQLAPGVSAPQTAWQPGPRGLSYPYAEYSDDGGTTWNTVRYTDANNYGVTSYQQTVYDYEAPPNAARLYRVRTGALDFNQDTTNGALVLSDPSDSTSTTLVVTDWYLVDPYTKTRIPIEFYNDGNNPAVLPMTSPTKQGIFDPLGSQYKIVLSDVSSGEEFALNLLFWQGADFDAFEVIRKTNHTLYLQSNLTRSWYINLISPRAAVLWMLDNNGQFRVTISAIQVARPN